MPSQLPGRQGLSEPARRGEHPEAGASNHWLRRVFARRAAPRGPSELPAHDAIHEQTGGEDAPPATLEYEESLVADTRWNVAPAQMVDRKLEALLRMTAAGVFNQVPRGAQVPASGDPVLSG